VIDESPPRDYPYYRGQPVGLTAAQWLVPLAGVALAVSVLLAQLSVFSEGALRFAPGLLLAFLPLAGLAVVAGRHWKTLFRRVHLNDIGKMFGFAALNFVIAIPLGFLTLHLVDAQINPAIAGMAASGTAERVMFFAGSVPQLIGEELISILPFLALLYYLTQKLSLSTKSAVIIAWLVTAVWFAAIHLPTYNWNILQCLIPIGGARLVLTLAYIRTKNLWVSAGAHIINDWTTFAFAIIGTGSAPT
jgi:uncharacterized protein